MPPKPEAVGSDGQSHIPLPSASVEAAECICCQAGQAHVSRSGSANTTPKDHCAVLFRQEHLTETWRSAELPSPPLCQAAPAADDLAGLCRANEECDHVGGCT
jgi:hypothetical protein